MITILPRYPRSLRAQNLGRANAPDACALPNRISVDVRIACGLASAPAFRFLIDWAVAVTVRYFELLFRVIDSPMPGEDELIVLLEPEIAG